MRFPITATSGASAAETIGAAAEWIVVDGTGARRVHDLGERFEPGSIMPGEAARGSMHGSQVGPGGVAGLTAGDADMFTLRWGNP